MAIDKKEIHLKNLIAGSIFLSVIIGLSGIFIRQQDILHLVWAVSTFLLIIGASLLGSKLSREGHDIPSAGFTVLAIAQGLLYGFVATHEAGNVQFGAGITIFIPALFLISASPLSPMIIRVAGFASAILFAIMAFRIYMEIDVSLAVNETLRNMGYLTMNAVFISWAWRIYKEKV